MEMKVDIQYLDERCRIKRATDGSIGYDMKANIEKPITIKIGERILVPLGIKAELGNKELGIFLFGRSGLALKNGIQLLNSVGVIDSDYRGEICAILYNTGATGEDFTIEPFDRVAQCIFIKAEKVVLIEKEELTDTIRGDGGFNSTGVK